jgi:uncharacterized protein with PQ loop repeat
MVESLGVAAAIWGAIMAVAPVLQIRRIVVRRSSADVSLGYLAVIQVGFGLWVSYGLALPNPFLVLPNALAFLFGAATILVAWRHRPGAVTENSIG